MSLDALAAQMNVTDAEIEAWAQKKYPQFLPNKTLIKRLYLIEKGVRFSAPFQPKELRSINQLVVGETADIQAVVVQELSTRSYIGCPNDSKKIPDAIEGKEAVCPKCGQIVKPKSLQWALFLVSSCFLFLLDATDEIIASLPPSIMNRPTEGMIIVAQGLLGENEEFLVYRWSLPADTKAGATPEKPLQSSFKPPPTTSPTPSPSTSPSTVSAPQATTPSTPAPSTPNTSLMCDQCNAGPFANALALAGHKTGAHGPKKTGKRMKKPGVEAYTPVSAPSTPIVSTPSPVSSVSAPSVTSQPTSAPVTEPESGPIQFVGTPEQATLPTETPEQTKKPLEQPSKGPSDSLLSASQVQAPAQTQPQTPQTASPKEAVREEIKAVEGASEGSIKYTGICGLLAKPLEESKLHFEVNFPKDDMARALEAAHCTIVEGKVVFVRA